VRDKPSNLDKRALFDLLRNPERVGRALGRAVRALQEELNPPTVSEEEYRAAVEQVDALETQVKELEERHEADQENIRQLVQQIAEQDKKLNAGGSFRSVCG
jgi:predicted  nucleic acid-binding Zn-ribbon protein